MATSLSVSKANGTGRDRHGLQKICERLPSQAERCPRRRLSRKIAASLPLGARVPLRGGMEYSSPAIRLRRLSRGAGGTGCHHTSEIFPGGPHVRAALRVCCPCVAPSCLRRVERTCESGGANRA